MGSCIPFEYLKHKLWLKERSGIKVPIWFLTIKSQELPWFTCVQVAFHISLESSQQGLQLCFTHHLNWRFAQKVISLQSQRSPNFSNLRLPSWKSWNKMTFGCKLHDHNKEYYKREGGGFCQFQVVMSLANLCMLVACPCTKSAPIMH